MKKLTVIFLLLVFVFNLVGYRYVIAIMSKKADTLLEAQIDTDHYDETALVEIRVDLNMPYQERYTDFERHYGEITIDGKPYTYVMRKIEGNVLVLKCIHNIFKDQLSNTSNEITKANSNQDQNNSQKQNTSLIKVIKSDYINYNSLDKLVFNKVIENIKNLPPLKSLPEVSIKPLYQPPRC